MDSTTQPIVCCVGERVAGNPTQFLLERLLTAGHIDWRVITVAVSPDGLAVALDGMRAMGFHAIRVLPSLRRIAAARIAPDDPLVQFVGAVTTAVSEDGGWKAWHHLGPTLLDWADAQVDLSSTLCWLHGDSLPSRAFLAAISYG